MGWWENVSSVSSEGMPPLPFALSGVNGMDEQTAEALCATLDELQRSPVESERSLQIATGRALFSPPSLADVLGGFAEDNMASRLSPIYGDPSSPFAPALSGSATGSDLEEALLGLIASVGDNQSPDSPCFGLDATSSSVLMNLGAMQRSFSADTLNSRALFADGSGGGFDPQILAAKSLHLRTGSDVDAGSPVMGMCGSGESSASPGSGESANTTVLTPGRVGFADVPGVADASHYQESLRALSTEDSANLAGHSPRGDSPRGSVPHAHEYPYPMRPMYPYYAHHYLPPAMYPVFPPPPPHYPLDPLGGLPPHMFYPHPGMLHYNPELMAYFQKMAQSQASSHAAAKLARERGVPVTQEEVSKEEFPTERECGTSSRSEGVDEDSPVSRNAGPSSGHPTPRQSEGRIASGRNSGEKSRNGRKDKGRGGENRKGQKAEKRGQGMTSGSTLKSDFKRLKGNRFELKDIFDHLVDFSQDQLGSRFIQKKLESATQADFTTAFEEILPDSLLLMNDVFGNYVVQKLFEHGSEEQRNRLAVKLNGQVLSLSLHMYGCRAVQRALEVLDADTRVSLARELSGYVKRCMEDQNGNHVIQKCIECIPSPRIPFIIDAVLAKSRDWAAHPYGCRVIQRILEHYNEGVKKETMVREIIDHACQLAKDQFGNYVVQHVIEHGNAPQRRTAISVLAPHTVAFSLHKFASNVVEKCLVFGNSEERAKMINKMLRKGNESGDTEPLQELMKDQFGNYVVQRLLEVCNETQRELLMSRVRAHVHGLKKFTYGKHIVARVEKLLQMGNRTPCSSPDDPPLAEDV